MNSQQFFIHDYAFYKDFKVVITKIISKDNKWYYEVRPTSCSNTLPFPIKQEELKRINKC